MNRRQRRADAARDRKAADRAEAIRLAYDCLATSDDTSVIGATLFMPDGSATYLSAADARAHRSSVKPKGRPL